MKNNIAILSFILLNLICFSAMAVQQECKKQKLEVFKRNDLRVQAVIIAQMRDRGATDSDVDKAYSGIEELSKNPKIVAEINELIELDLISNKVTYYIKTMKSDHIARLRRQAKKAVATYRDCIRLRTRVNF